MKSLNELQAFKFGVSDLRELYSFNKMIEYVVNNSKSELYDCEIDYTSKDNFGAYSVGYRIYLKHKTSNKILYIYFGYIFNYIKQAGIFAEVDYNSNKDFYEQVCTGIKTSPYYTVNRKEAPFLKLFYSEDAYKELVNEKSYEEQLANINCFFYACCEIFVNNL